MHKKLPQSTVKLVLPSNESYESKTGCNRTLATVLWVPLKEGVGEGLAEKVGKGLAEGWRRVGTGLTEVGEGLADFLAPSNFGIPEAPV